MALVGLDNVHVAKITIDPITGKETYGVPVKIAHAIEANISPQTDTQNIHADDTVAEIISVFGSVEVGFTISDLGSENYALLLGKEKDANGVLIDDADDEAPFFALMFRSKKSNGEYRYITLYKGKFNAVSEAYSTQAGNADHQNQPITGTFVKRSDGKWRARVDSDDATIGAGVVEGWFADVYESAPVTP